MHSMADHCGSGMSDDTSVGLTVVVADDSHWCCRSSSHRWCDSSSSASFSEKQHLGIRGAATATAAAAAVAALRWLWLDEMSSMRCNFDCPTPDGSRSTESSSVEGRENAGGTSGGRDDAEGGAVLAASGGMPKCSWPCMGISDTAEQSVAVPEAPPAANDDGETPSGAGKTPAPIIMDGPMLIKGSTKLNGEADGSDRLDRGPAAGRCVCSGDTASGIPPALPGVLPDALNAGVAGPAAAEKLLGGLPSCGGCDGRPPLLVLELAAAVAARCWSCPSRWLWWWWWWW